MGKAAAVAEQYPSHLVIGSDQVAVNAGAVLGKPGSFERAVEQLQAASGKVVQFYTGLTLLNSASGEQYSEVVPFQVHFRELSSDRGDGDDADGNDDFNGIMRVIKRKDYQIENPKFKIFDMITQNDFDTKKSTTTLGERITTLENITSLESSQYIDVLAQEIVTSQNVFNKWADWVKEFNWEGFMLRKDATYIGTRSNQLLKVKK